MCNNVLLNSISFLLPGDTTDATVKNAVEKELGMPVQRLYPLENEYHRKLLEKIVGSEEISLPFLYHRESKHSLLGGLEDGDQVRSWAKGRKPRQAEAAIMEKDIEKLLEEEFEEGLSDMEELWGDMDEMGEEDSLETKGKQSIKKRTRSQI